LTIKRKLSNQKEGQLLISEFSKRFIDLPSDEAESVMSEVLDAIGIFLEADRAYVFQLEQDGVTLRQVYGFSQPYLPEHLQFSVDAWWVSMNDSAPTKQDDYVTIMLENLGPEQKFVVTSIDALEESSRIRQMLANRGIRSVMAVPMVEGTRVTGFLGVDTIEKEHAWSEDDRAFLLSVVELLQ